MRHPTYYASLLKQYLQKIGLKVDQEVYDGHKHIDLSIDTAKLDIEVDGMHHLTDPKQIITDIKRSNHSREDGYETIHVHNVDIRQDVEGIAQAIAQVSAKREEDIDIMAGIIKDSVGVPKQVIDVFTRIRDIPYSIPLSSSEEDFCCTGKHKQFLAYLQKEKYEVRWRVCAFKWSSLNLPQKTLSAPHVDDCTHAYLQVLIDGEWRNIDLTWDSQLATILPVNNWDGTSDTVIAVPVIEVYSPEESLEIIQSENKDKIESDLNINGEFYKAVNEWLEEVRRN